MKFKILNEELKLVAVDSLRDLDYIQIEKIKKIIPEGEDVKDITFFYIPDRDWIVINKSHELYEVVVEIITIYLKLAKESRIKAYDVADKEMKYALDILNSVIMRRTLEQ